MKKFLLLSAFIILSQYSYSQLYLGVSSGVSITKIKNDGYANFNYTSLVGFNAELPVFYKLNKNIGFQSGISYISMGHALKFKANMFDPYDPIYEEFNKKYFFRLNYLSLPLTFNFSLPLNKYSIYGKAGGYLSYLLNANVKNDKSDEKEKADLNDGQYKIHRMDAGLLFGAGATRTLGNGFLFFDVRYMIGCTDLNKGYNSFDAYLLTKTAYNRGLLLNLGYMFNLGKVE